MPFYIVMVPVVGLEPTRPQGQQILSLHRLPIPTYRLEHLLLYNKPIDKSSFILSYDTLVLSKSPLSIDKS